MSSPRRGVFSTRGRPRAVRSAPCPSLCPRSARCRTSHVWAAAAQAQTGCCPRLPSPRPWCGLGWNTPAQTRPTGPAGPALGPRRPCSHSPRPPPLRSSRQTRLLFLRPIERRWRGGGGAVERACVHVPPLQGQPTAGPMAGLPSASGDPTAHFTAPLRAPAGGLPPHLSFPSPGTRLFPGAEPAPSVYAWGA